MIQMSPAGSFFMRSRIQMFNYIHDGNTNIGFEINI